ncbi:unnamed protein product [Rhizophagus irregularis]|nr:unnamed protein product [Rhizophagus irregularis]
MHQFKELIDLNLIQSSPSGSLSQQRHHSQLHSFIFGVQVTANPFSELESYLDPICIPIADHSVNPFECSSVPSERLFSDAGNQITAKRTCLNSKLAGKMM